MWPFSRKGRSPRPAAMVMAPVQPTPKAAVRLVVDPSFQTDHGNTEPAEPEDEYSGSQPPQFSEVRLRLVPLPDDGRLNVVGESHYQEALAVVAGGRTCGATFDEHIPVVAVLVPEPENPWDENAVRVDVLMGNRSLKVGYLSAGWAEDYQPELLELRAEGALGTCPARVTGGGDKYYGIYLHVARPEELRSGGDPIVAETTATGVLLRNDWSCTVTKEEEHQDVLRAFAPKGKQEYREVVASLGFCTIRGGKYAGGRAIEVRLGGKRVGQLTHAMTTRYGEIVARFAEKNLAVTCEAYTTRTAKGVEVELRMPRDPKRF